MSTQSAIALLQRALTELAPAPDKSVHTVLDRLVPVGVQLYASCGRDGRWHYYLTMPIGWVPPEGGSRWLYNENSGCYWDTGLGCSHTEENTEAVALRGGLVRLLGIRT